MMKRIYFVILALMSVFMARATDYYAKGETLLEEKFSNLEGYTDDLKPADMSKFDNPEGWILKDVYAGNGCVYVKRGGSITLPAIEGLTGNAALYIMVREWVQDDYGEDEEYHGRYHMTIENGELLTSEFDLDSSMTGSKYMFGVSSDTRLTIHADDSFRIQIIELYYGTHTFQNKPFLSQCEPDAGEYYDKIDITVSTSRSDQSWDYDGSHNFCVYTLDGTEPTRTSPRVTGPIHLEEDATLIIGTVLGDGGLFIDQPRKYEFKSMTAPDAPDGAFEISIEAPGQLQNQLKQIDADEITGLVLKGKINGEDLSYLSSGTGRMGSLTYLNLSEVTFEYDDTEYAQITYAPEGGMGTTTVIHYFFSEENRTEQRPGNPSLLQYASYRNNLAGAFYRHPTLKHVVLPSFMTSLGESAFSKCEELEYVTTEGKITEVKSDAFSSTRNFKYFDLSSLEKIGPTAFSFTEIKGPVDLSKATEIGTRAFTGTKITSVSLGNALRLGESAFADTKITTLDLPIPPDSIPADAFNCETLKKVTLGEGLKFIGDRAFGKAEEISLPSSVEEIGIDVISDKALANIEAEDGIKYVGKVAYARVSDQTEFTIKDGTVSLSPRLFQWSNVESVTLPASLRIIGDEAFDGAKLKKTPEMPGVVRIGDWAFKSNGSMTRATLPETLEYLGGNVFYDCNALWKLEYNCIDLQLEWPCTNTQVEEIVIGSKVKRIPRGLFYNNSTVTEVVFPASVEIIDESAFNSCTKLVSITSEGAIKSIGSNAFSYCKSLEEVPLLDVDTIPSMAFRDCENLKGIRTSDRLKCIESDAFWGCSNLKDFYWSLGLEKIANSAFNSCESLETISLPEGIKDVEYYAFNNCKSVKTLYIPSTITSFDAGAFDFRNNEMGATVTCMLPEPPAIKNSYWSVNNCVALAKVPAASLEAYKSHPDWAFLGDNIVAVEGISAPEKTTVTSFAEGIDEDTDLSDTVVGDVYVTLGEEDSYDAEDGSIVLGSTIDSQSAEVLVSLAPGESDLANRFNGIVVKVGEGVGTVKIDCKTIGSNLLTVKLGSAKHQTFRKDEKGDVDVPYNVAEPTYVYVYGSLPESSAKPKDRKNVTRAAEDGCVRLYSVLISPNDAPLEIEVESLTISQTELKMTEGDSATLTASIKPEDATDKTVTWTSSDEVVATVSAEGVVTAVKAGTSTITATSANGKTATCSVTVEAKVIEVTEVVISQTELKLTEGDTATLTATIKPADATDKTVTWTSSEEAVATVSAEGLVTAVKAGTATITATSANGKTATCSVTVETKVIEVTEVVISQTELKLTEGDTATLTATIKPEDATDKTVTWTSSDANVATVSAEGLVTAVKAGTATITATSANGKTATCSVTVETKVIEVTEVVISQNQLNMTEGDTATLTASIKPEDATDKTVTWTSSDEAVATVSAEGVVTAVKAGTATITATSANGKTASCSVTVEANIIEVSEISISQPEMTLTEGDTATLTVSIAPDDATDKTVTWSSSDEAVATVSAEGIVTAVKEGTATITATTANGKTAICAVTVEAKVILAESLILTPDTWSGEEGSSFTITATVLPGNVTNNSLSWESSDESVATVDEHGNVTVVKEGSCVITVRTLDGSNLSAQCVITGLSGIDFIFASESSVDVFNQQGIRLKHNCSREDLERLQPGIYILRIANGKSVVFVHHNR